MKSIYPKWVLGIAFLVFCTLAKAQDQSRATWENEMREKMQAVSSPPSIEDLRLLAVLSTHRSAENQTMRKVGEDAWMTLSAIPDFADQLLQAILEGRAKWRAERGFTGDYDRLRCWTMESVGKLPDYRCVRLLGELLSDTEKPREEGVILGAPSNARLAARSLEQLLENPPTHEDKSRDADDDLVSWQLWYEQLKAGNRTFRLKGDPQEYSLKGPATAAMTPSGTRAASSGSGLAPTSPGGAPSSDVPSGRWTGVALAAACCVLLFAAFKALRPRR